MKVKIERLGINGEGVAYLDKKPIFVEGALPEEIVDIQIVDRYKTYSKAKIHKIIQKSDKRTAVPCKYAKNCGACALLHAEYDLQLKAKKELVREALVKYAKIDEALIEDVIPSPQHYGYRNSFKLPITTRNGQLTCGLYQRNSRRIQYVDSCLIHEQGLERVKRQLLEVLNRHHMEAYDAKEKTGLRTLIVRGFQEEYQCCLVTGKDELSKELIQDCLHIKGLKSLWQSINTVKKSIDPFGKTMIYLAGDKYLNFEFDGLRLNLSPRSFFQLNSAQAQNLYRYVKQMTPSHQTFIVEAYSGIGAISLYVHDKAQYVVGIESIQDAISNANLNAKQNHIDNVKFRCADAAEELTFQSKKHKVDTLIVDPPRTGLDDAMLYAIQKSRIDHVIYISCNPATLGKNLSVLLEDYVIEHIQPFDMFPQTANIECVVSLVRKDKGICN